MISDRKDKMPDGTILENGLTVSQIGRYYSAVYRCECRRQQKASCKHEHFLENGGISVKIAEHFGWRKINNKWLCPFCSGNTANLNKFFRS